MLQNDSANRPKERANGKYKNKINTQISRNWNKQKMVCAHHSSCSARQILQSVPFCLWLVFVFFFLSMFLSLHCVLCTCCGFKGVDGFAIVERVRFPFSLSLSIFFHLIQVGKTPNNNNNSQLYCAIDFVVLLCGVTFAC